MSNVSSQDPFIAARISAWSASDIGAEIDVEATAVPGILHGEGIEIDVEILHINGQMHNSLAAVGQHQRTLLMGN